MPCPAARPTLASVCLALALSAATATLGCASARTWTPKPADETPLTASERALNAAAFDALWDRVNTSYFRPARLDDPAVDWAGTRDTFRPKIEAAPTRAAARTLMNEALGRLQETHFGVVAGDGEATPSAATDAAGFVGMELRPVDVGGVLRPIVWQIESASPAATAGVRTGWLLTAVGDENVSTLDVGRDDPALARIRAVEHLHQRIAGPRGQPVRLTFRDGRGRRQIVDVTPGVAPDGRMTRLGNLPAMDLRIASKTLPTGVGYFGFSVFLDPPRVMPAFTKFIAQHESSPGIVIDLRGNPGGLGAMATGLCGFLVDRPGLKLGTMTTRDGSLQFVVNPRTPRFDGPVAVLVDEFSLSTSEILSGGLKDLGRARIFGQRTPGAALPSTVMPLPNGDLFQYAVADYVSAGGERLEGIGVTPDEIVPLTRDDLLSGRDRALEAAVAWIASQRPAAVLSQLSATPPPERAR